MSILAERPFQVQRDTPAFRPSMPSGNLFVRSLTARAIASLYRRSTGVTPADVAAEMWPSDKTLAHILTPSVSEFTRAASAPAMTSVVGWAAELAQRMTADAVEALGPASAGAEVLKRGLVLSWNGAAAISAPGFVSEFGNAGWVAEGVPIPVRQLAATPAIINPHKLGAIAVLTREMIESSNAEQLIGDALVKAAGRMLDEVLFDANPEDASRPKGLRNGVATLTASNNADPFAAVFEDVGLLINSLAPVAGAGPYILVANPARAMTMSFRLANVPGNNLTVIGSSAVVNDMLAIAPGALVAALSPEPEVETANSATLHMDTAPTAVGSASPHRSLYQTDSIAIKVRWPVSWVLRDPRGFAWLTPAWK